MLELQNPRSDDQQHGGEQLGNVGKVVSQQDLILRCRARKDNGEKVVLVGGIFDLLHPGHVRLLEQARQYGEVLAVAVLNDSSVRAIEAAEQAERETETRASGGRGPISELKLQPPQSPAVSAVFVPARKSTRSRGIVQRPVTPATERAEIVAALAAVDHVVEVGLDGLPELLAQLRPEVAVESAELSSSAPLARAAKDVGVKLVRIPFEPGHSTAGIIERIVQLSGSE
jgi:cytidyltransferase-like protein